MTGYALTPLEAKALAFLQRKLKPGKAGPSFPEIAVGIGLSEKSKSTVFHLMKALEDRGHIHRLKNRARAIALGPEPHPKRCPHCFHVVRA